MIWRILIFKKSVWVGKVGRRVSNGIGRVDLIFFLIEILGNEGYFEFLLKLRKVIKLVLLNNILMFGEIFGCKRFLFNKDYFCC